MGSACAVQVLYGASSSDKAGAWANLIKQAQQQALHSMGVRFPSPSGVWIAGAVEGEGSPPECCRGFVRKSGSVHTRQHVVSPERGDGVLGLCEREEVRLSVELDGCASWIVFCIVTVVDADVGMQRPARTLVGALHAGQRCHSKLTQLGCVATL